MGKMRKGNFRGIQKGIKMKKMCVIVDDLREFGGREKWVLNVINLLKNTKFSLLTYLDKNGYGRININQLIKSKDVKIINFNVIQLPIIKEKIPAGIASVIAFKEIKDFDVIYSTTQNIFINLFFMAAAKLYNKRFIVGLHGSIIFRDFLYSKNSLKIFFLPLYNKIQRKVFFLSKEIHVINNQQKIYLLKNGYHGVIHYIPYFIFDNPYSRTFNKNPKPKFNQKFFNVLFIGRLSEFDKGTDLLSKIIKSLNAKTKKIRFYIVGTGPEENTLKKVLNFPNVIFCGFQSGESLKNIYKNSDLLITTSRYESFGLNILEAQINGIPVIAFKTDGALEIIKKPFQGSLIKKYDIKAYVKEVIKYYNGRASYKNKNLIKKYIYKQFDKNNAKRKLIYLFNRVDYND